MDSKSHGVVEFMREVEEAAEDVLTTKQQIVDLDIKRNRNREALCALKNGMCSEKVKVCFGHIFVKLPKSKARKMIQRDQQQLDSKLNELHKRLKSNVNHLNETQGKPELSSYNLLPLSTNEMNAMKSVLKGRYQISSIAHNNI
ncbi:p53 and DNA damage-regulated protein 1 [Syngnathoides biaculeatus]|uniref:p53 and DNA damage-regulated protein 1 n=1 Tax=Syngnathoides biaculeatus TaxID=300417 RepID=UPI002ADE3939|nr:p53 and DNA damage-regulated protein 1 [Syngnathoides biaculeatus]